VNIFGGYMKVNAIIAEYYEIIIEEGAAAATKMFSIISKIGISLLAYKSVSLGENKTKFILFALKSKEMYTIIKNEGLEVNGPFPGLFLNGDDVPGSLADIFKKLAKENIRIVESCGIANINNGYGVVLYLNKGDVEKAYKILMD
jgi:hypothetical protein